MKTQIEHVLDELARALRGAHGLTSAWKQHGDAFDGEVVHAWCGAPDAAHLAAADAALKASFGAPMPDELRALLARFDGIAVGPISPGEVKDAPEVILGHDLVEPQIFCAQTLAERGADLAQLELIGDLRLVEFGELADSGTLAIALPDDAEDVRGVFWVDAEVHLVAPHFLAPDLTTLIRHWVEADLRLQVVLQRAKAPGWTG